MSRNKKSGLTEDYLNSFGKKEINDIKKRCKGNEFPVDLLQKYSYSTLVNVLNLFD